jgi:hypothetical protein
MAPKSGVHLIESSYSKGFGIASSLQYSEYRGSGPRHHGGIGFRLFQEELLEFGEESVLFEDGALKIIEESLLVDLLRDVRNSLYFSGILPV